MPKRIQRKRTKGWRMPEGAVCVTRPGKWGNPFTVKQCREAGYAVGDSEAAQICVDAYRAWMTGRKHWAHAIPMPEPPDISALRGKDLACYCKPGEPCHADVLLELANSSESHGGAPAGGVDGLHRTIANAKRHSRRPES